jgi:single-stranded DNA-specific DHH superfamily exonuclease
MGRGAGARADAAAKRSTATLERPSAETPGLPSFDPDQAWWQPDPATELRAKQIARELDYDPIVCQRLAMLGYSAQDIANYLNPGPQHVVDPETTCPGMKDAAEDLIRGIRAGEKVAVYGDYDVDGATSLAIIQETLEAHDAEVFAGSANAVSGFGLSRNFVEEAHARDAKWLITVDCGSTQTEPVRLAQSLGMQVIIIDHHEVDADNPAAHHLNPRKLAVHAMRQFAQAVEISECQQKLLVLQPYAEQLDKLTERSVKILRDYFGEENYQRLSDTVHQYGNPANTGAVLSWKFAAAVQQAADGKVSASHWGRPMYMAGLGAVADMAPSDNQEIRAFIRVPTDKRLQRAELGNRRVIPRGIEMLAEELGEDPLRPDSMIRTRALMNLPKRTAEINGSDIQRLLRSDDPAELAPVVQNLVRDYERLSAIRRNEMDPIALEQVAEAAARGEDTYFAYAALDGFENVAGYTRMVANTLCKQTGKPAVVFARKTTDASDEFGQTLYKFSGANMNVPEAKLGELIDSPALRQACRIQQRDWVGEPTELESIGGHAAVVSGVVRAENIEAAKTAVEAWAGEKDRKRKWRPIDNKRPRVNARKVTGTRFARLEREAELLAPFSFPEAPALTVSTTGRFTRPRLREDERYHARLSIDGGLERPVVLAVDAAEIIAAHPRQRFEAITALGNSGPLYVKHLRAID